MEWENNKKKKLISAITFFHIWYAIEWNKPDIITEEKISKKIQWTQRNV